MDFEKGIDVDLPAILDGYFYHGLHPGSFYKAVIHNDLRTAVSLKHELIDIKKTIMFIDCWMTEHNIEMEFLKNVD